MKHEKLYLTCTRKPSPNGYHYLIYTGAATNFTAFRTYKALRKWMDDRVLRAKYCHTFGTGHASLEIYGPFEERMIMDQATWDNIPDPNPVPFLSNGEYTLAKRTLEGDTRVLTYLNPNVRTRPVLPYRDTTAYLDEGKTPTWLLALPPIRWQSCAICGEQTRGRQWHNRDTGFGVCLKCVEQHRGVPGLWDEFASCYGVRGIHFDVREES